MIVICFRWCSGWVGANHDSDLLRVCWSEEKEIIFQKLATIILLTIACNIEQDSLGNQN
jgi:hypothetical protein